VVNNNSVYARKLAFSSEGLGRLGLSLNRGVSYQLYSDQLESAFARKHSPASPIQVIEIVLDDEIDVRLDRLIAIGIGISRSECSMRLKSGTIRILSDDKRAHRRPAQNGQKIVVDTSFFRSL
jgi:hypothetical protein